MKFPKLSFRKKSAKSKTKEEVDSSSGPSTFGTSSSSGAKQWLILNVEKILLVVAVGAFGLLLYSAIGKLSPDPKHTPEALAKSAQGMEERINASKEEATGDKTPPDFAAQVDWANRKIEPGSYAFDSLIGPEASKRGKRGRPQFLEVTDVWGRGGSGIFWVQSGDNEPKNIPPGKKENNDKKGKKTSSPRIFPGVRAPKGSAGVLKHWAVITAILPVRKQQEIYERFFRENAGYDAREDVPKYLLARIQRIEVPSDVKNFEPDWNNPDIEWEWGIKNKDNSPEQDLPTEDPLAGITAMDRMVDIRESDKWATGAKEVVDARYTHDGLTMPLGPLAFVTWQPWATHPDIPLAVSRVGEEFDKPKRRNVVRGANARVNTRKTTPIKKSTLLDRFRKSKPNEAPPEAAVSKAPDEEAPIASAFGGENKLVRLFDFDVQPGKTYLYRVQLLLENPNYEKPARSLKNPQDHKWALTPNAWLEWSEQSNPVRIPKATSVHAASVQKAKNNELSLASVIIKTPTDTDGKLRVGELQLKPGGSVSGLLDNSLTIDGLSGKISKEDHPVDVDLLLVDIRSHDSDQQDAEVSELLFLDSGGQFLLRNTASDQTQKVLFDKISGSFANKNKEKQEVKKKEKDGEESEDKDRFIKKDPERPSRR